jgi:hypothetical protein
MTNEPHLVRPEPIHVFILKDVRGERVRCRGRWLDIGSVAGMAKGAHDRPFAREWCNLWRRIILRWRRRVRKESERRVVLRIHQNAYGILAEALVIVKPPNLVARAQVM